MSNVPYPPQRPLSVGEILDLAFRIYRATVIKCLLFAALGVIAGQLPRIYLLAKGEAQMNVQTLVAQLRQPAFWTTYVVGVVLTILFYAAVLLRQRAMITDAPAGGEAGSALRRTPALIVLGVLIGLTLVACFTPAAIVAGTARGLVVLLALIPASYVLVMLLSAQTVLLVDTLGPVASYARSWRLSTGCFWRLSLIYTIAGIVLLVLYFVVGVVAALVAGILGRGDVALVTASGAVLLVAIAAFATPFYTALALAILGDLRVRKEGADLAQRISALA